MSFSSDVKKELAEHVSPGRHCQIAELAALISYGGRMQIQRDGAAVVCHAESGYAEEKLNKLLKKTGFSGIDYAALQAAKLLSKEGTLSPDLRVQSRLLTQRDCCKRAFIRGAFLASGTMSDPRTSSYHFEIIASSREKAENLREMIASFDIGAKVTKRKQHHIVYIKESSGIVDILGVMEAHVALMALENVRILKEIGNKVNRRVNCETANLNKTVSAAVRQREEIQFLMDHAAYRDLPDSLKEAAQLRLDYPDATIKELGEMLDPPVGKSGMNHRLRKISELAEKYRNQ